MNCPRCLTGRLYLNLDGDSSCFGCGHVEYTFKEPLDIPANGGEVGYKGSKTKQIHWNEEGQVCEFGHPMKPTKVGYIYCPTCASERQRPYHEEAKKTRIRKPRGVPLDQAHCKNGHPYERDARGARYCPQCAHERAKHSGKTEMSLTVMPKALTQQRIDLEMEAAG